MQYAVISKNRLKEIVKLHQKKYRDDTGLFIAEGIKSFEELISTNIEIIEIYTLKELNLQKINCPVYLINDETMNKISSTKSPCEILIVAKQIKYRIDDIIKLNRLILIDSVSDPGNLGTLIRSAAAFSIDGIILFGNCVDLYSPKVIRSTAGNLFKIPVIHINTVEEFNQYFKNHTKIATALSKTNNISFKECKEIKKSIIMFGSEANGLCSDLIKAADKNIRIEMENKVESLNLAVSASIIMYEIYNV